MKAAALLSLLLTLGAPAAPPKPVSAPPPKAAPVPEATATASDALVAQEVRVLELDEKRANKVYRIRTAPGFQTVVEFPDGFASAPSCGDCVDGASPQLDKSPALFVLQAFDADNYIAVKPLRFSREEGGDGPPEDEFQMTVTVRLKSKLTVTLLVEYAPRAQADARVVFTLPNRGAESQYVRDQVAKARAELAEDFARRLAESSTRVLLSALLDTPKCRTVRRQTRQGDVRLEVLHLCRLGSKVFVRFAVENRGRGELAVGEVALHQQHGKGESQPVDDTQLLLSDDELAFREVAKGVIGFELAEGTEAATSYALHLTERTGDGQPVVVDAFHF